MRAIAHFLASAPNTCFGSLLCITERLSILLIVGFMYPVRSFLLSPPVPPNLRKNISTSWKARLKKLKELWLLVHLVGVWCFIFGIVTDTLPEKWLKQF